MYRNITTFRNKASNERLRPKQEIMSLHENTRIRPISNISRLSRTHRARLRMIISHRPTNLLSHFRRRKHATMYMNTIRFLLKTTLLLPILISINQSNSRKITQRTRRARTTITTRIHRRRNINTLTMRIPTNIRTTCLPVKRALSTIKTSRRRHRKFPAN